MISDALTIVNSATRIPQLSKALNNRGMQLIEEIYRARLRLLVEEAGTQKALAERIGKAPAQISQWLNASKDSKTGKPRVMDRSTAREIEQAFPKPHGWMDQPVGLDPAIPATLDGFDPAPPRHAGVEPSNHQIPFAQAARLLGESVRSLSESRRRTISMLVAAQIADEPDDAELEAIDSLAAGTCVALPALEDDDRAELLRLRNWHNAVFSLAEHEPGPERAVIAAFLQRVQEALVDRAKAHSRADSGVAHHPLST